MNKKKRKKISALILLLGITIGYALLSTTLRINGIAGIKSSNWDIHWENVQVNQESTITTEEPSIDTNRTTVSYEVELELPGDYYEFTVDAKNDGSINGMIDEVRHNVYEVVDGVPSQETTTLPQYILYSIVYDGTGDTPQEGDILESGEKQTYRIRIEYDSEATILPSTTKTYKIIDEIDYVQTKESKDIDGFIIDQPTNGPILGGLTIGDEICIGNDTVGKECFNVITSDNNKTMMLAKYNLLVGYDCTNSTQASNYELSECPLIPQTTTGYGKQYAGSYMQTGDRRNLYAITSFSSSDYWYGNVGPEGSGKKYKGTVYSTGYNSHFTEYEYYSSPLPYVYDENSDLYQPIQNYISYLKTIGADTATTGRLLSEEEATNYFDCSFTGGYCYKVDDDANKYGFIQNTEYWTGTAIDGTIYHDYTVFSSIEAIKPYTEGNGGADWRDPFGYGVRPVIEVPTSSIVFKGWRLLNPGSTGTNQQYEYWIKGRRIEEGLVPNLPDFSNSLRTYYFKNGLVQYGWQKIDNKIYYFSEIDTDLNGYTDGNMVYGNTINISGTDYTFDNDGVCISNNCPNL